MMKLVTREDIEAPLATVFATFADTETWERAALRRGAEVTRVDRLATFGPGMAWAVAFDHRGKTRKMTVKLSKAEVPNALGFEFSAPSVEGTVALDFVELGPRRTRVSVLSEVKPRTLAARLVMQSMKLARGKVEQKYATRIAMICGEIEDRLRGAPTR